MSKSCKKDEIRVTSKFHEIKYSFAYEIMQKEIELSILKFKDSCAAKCAHHECIDILSHIIFDIFEIMKVGNDPLEIQELFIKQMNNIEKFKNVP